MPRYMQAKFVDASGSISRVRPRLADDAAVLPLANALAACSDAALYELSQQDVTYYTAPAKADTSISTGATIYVGSDLAALTALELWSMPAAAFLPDGVSIDTAWPPLAAFVAALPADLQPLQGGHLVIWSGG